MRLLIISLCIGILLLSQLGGCDSKDDVDNFFKDPEPAAIESTLKTAIPVGYAASLAMNAMAGDQAPNVTIVNNQCTSGPASYPCSAWISIVYDQANYPMPVETGGSGEIIVVGLWTSIDTAILSVFFTNLNLYTGSFILYDVDIFPVVRTGSLVTAVYADIDVNVGATSVFPFTLTAAQIAAEENRFASTSPPNPPLPPNDSQVRIEEEAWIVDVDNNSTFANFSDDVYTINGAGQYIGASAASASIQQVVFLSVRMSPACVFNPTDGFSIINDIEVSPGSSIYGLTLGSVLISYHAVCDGTADITAAVGSYVLSIGDSLILNLSP